MGADVGTEHVLTAEQKASWDRDGFLRFDPGCPMELIDGALKDLEQHYIWGNERRIENGVIYSGGASPRIRDAWKLTDKVKAIALLPRAQSALRELHERDPQPFQTLNFPIPTQQAPHSDAIHFNTDPPGQMCGVWIAFEDIDMDNGPLVYYPGSQKLPFTSYEDVGFDAKRDDFPSYDDFIHARNKRYEAYVASLIEQHGLEPQYGTITKGEGIIWSANLIHGGTPRRDENRTRHSQVTHYLFDSARCFTELRTENGNRVWTEPDWIV